MQISEEELPTIFCDMDQVLVDFIGGAEDAIGEPFATSDKDQRWKKIANTKKIHSDVVFYHIALPMLESLEEKPEFEEACDTAVCEAVYTKLEDTGVIIHDPEF